MAMKKILSIIGIAIITFVLFSSGCFENIKNDKANRINVNDKTDLIGTWINTSGDAFMKYVFNQDGSYS
jgi:hypothetical protein